MAEAARSSLFYFTHNETVVSLDTLRRVNYSVRAILVQENAENRDRTIRCQPVRFRKFPKILNFQLLTGAALTQGGWHPIVRLRCSALLVGVLLCSPTI